MSMYEKDLIKALKLLWKSMFEQVTGYKKWAAEIKPLHSSYQFLFAFFFLHPKLLPQRIIGRLRSAFFKKQGLKLVKQLDEEINQTPRAAPVRIKVYNVKALLDYCIEIKESRLIAPVSNAVLAKIIDDNFDTGLSKETIINYIERNSSEKL